jgi:hypothetical protein
MEVKKMFNSSLSRRLALTVISAAAITLAGCGGTVSSTSGTTALTVTPALGAAYGATVYVYSATGTLLGSGTTGSDGKANVSLTGYTAGQPVIIRTVLGVGSFYFNEKTGANTTPVTASEIPVTLMAVVPAVATGQAVGVTPLTNMAAAFVGVTAATTTPTKTVTSAAVYEAVAKTNLALGLPAATNITEAPIAATASNWDKVAGVITGSSTATGAVTGKILAEMAKASTSTPAAQAVALAAAVNTTTGAIVTGTTPTVLTSVNTALATAATTLSITVVAPVTAPSTSQVSEATTTATAVVGNAVPGAVQKPTGTGTGSVGTGG